MMRLPNSKQLFRYIYLIVIGFLIGLIVSINFLPNPRLANVILMKNHKIEQQQRMIDGLLEELPTQN